MSMERNDYDSLWKEIIAHLFEDFLLFFAPDLYEQVDFTREHTFLEQELHKVSQTLKQESVIRTN